MLKEFFICTVIVILIFVGNGITQGYSKKSIEDMNENLTSLEENMNVQDETLNHEEVDKKVEEIDQKWKEMFYRLAYYIEHEELEKFSRNLENIKSYAQLEQYDDAIKEINEGKYILNHIEDKYSFNLQNIF